MLQRIGSLPFAPGLPGPSPRVAQEPPCAAPEAPPGPDLARRLAMSAPPGGPRPALPLQPPVPPKATEAAEAPESRPEKKSLLRRLARVAFWTGMTAATGLTAVGGIAWQANREALSRPPSISRTLEGVRSTRPRTPPSMVPAPTRAARPAGPVKVPANGVTVVLPADTLSSFAHNLQEEPGIKRFIEGRIAASKTSLMEHLQELEIPPGQELVDLEAPLPTGQRPLLRVGEVDLPSFGVRALQRENLPLTFEHRLDPVKPNLDVSVEPVRVDQPVRPAGMEGGAFLGAVRVRITAPDGRIPVTGTARLSLDLDGNDTRALLERYQGELNGTPVGSARAGWLQEAIPRLQARLGQARHLKAVSSEAGIQELLRESVQDQRVRFEMEVRTGPRPLAEATYHLWVGPDSTGDGRSDLHVAEVHDVQGLEGLDLRARRIDSVGQGPESRLGGFLHERVEGQFESGIRKALPQVAAEVRRLAGQQVAAHFREGVDRIQGVGNQQLLKAYQEGQRIRVPIPGGLVRDVHLSLDDVRTEGGSVVLHFQSGETRTGEVELRLPPGMRLEEGQAAVRVSGAELNQQLQDRSEGGAVDWKGLLQGLRERHGMPTLEFGKDAAGRTVYPRVSLEDGAPAIVFDLLVQPEGLSPVKGGTGLVQGATGALDGGLAELQDGLKKEAGVVGDVAGTVVRAPFFLLNKVVEGVKFGVDNTVGLVVDAVPEVATRPTLHTKVVIPMQVQAREGRLHVEPDVAKVRLGEADTQKPSDLLDVLPTRMLSNLIVNAVAQAEAPGRIGEGARQAQVDLDLSKFGLELREVGVVERGGGPPDLVFKLQAHQGAVDFASQQILFGLLRGR